MWSIPKGAIRAATVVAIAAMFVAALPSPTCSTVPDSLFGVAFLIVGLMHLALFVLSACGDRALLAAILRIAPLTVAGAALIIAAAFVHGGLKPAFWLVALAVGFVGPLFVGVSGWRIRPAHFAERHGLILIIAIGESLHRDRSGGEGH